MLRSPLIAAAALAAAACVQAAEVWPQPQSITTGSTATYLSPAFAFSCGGSVCPDPLPAAFERYTNILFVAGTPSLPAGPNAITGLVITVGAQAPLRLNVSESYTLNVPANGVATATADNQWGALRAMESFSQLFVWQGDSAQPVYECDAAPVAITDFPRYPWRGVLIDSSRHFLTVSAIKVTLDAMSYNKLNTMHWHWTDDQSWSVFSAALPNMSAQGAYAPSAVYSHADVMSIVSYAFERGIRVIPEFDMPGHAAIWGRGYPELTVSCSNGQTLLNPSDGSGIYQAVDSLLKEFAPILGTDTVHFGGDEVSNYECWLESAEVAAWMQSKGFGTNVSQARNYFESQIQSIAEGYGLKSMFWEEVFDNGYDLLPQSIVDIWLSDNELDVAVQAGHQVVASFGYYLDQQTPDGPTHYFWADTWQNFFLNDPLLNTTLTPAQQQQVLGISLSQWGEQCDAANIQSRMWPRASGGAERAWSPATVRDVNVEEGRLDRFRCKMVQRGIGAGPIRPASEYGYCPIPELSKLNSLHELRVPARV